MRNLEVLVLPANGDVLTPMRILIVGSSTTIRARASCFSMSLMVSPMVTPSMPAIATTSPATAASAAVRRRPSNV